MLLSPYIYLGTGGYLINFLNVLPVALPAAKATSYPTNRTLEKPKRVMLISPIINNDGSYAFHTPTKETLI